MPPEEYASVVESVTASALWSSFEEYCDAYPAKSYIQFLARWHKYLELSVGERSPLPQDFFNATQVPGYDDGIWPDWVEQQMIEWLPRSVANKFGQEKSSWVSGEFLSLDVNRTAEIVAALEALGYECQLSSELVCRACGYDRRRQVRH